MKLGRVLLGAVLLGVLGVGGVTAWRRRGVPAHSRVGTAAATADVAPNDSLARAPAGARVRVQVVNATSVNGLARRATRYLRDRGFDVVDIGATKERLDTTVVIDRSGHADWARRAARAMGGARIDARADSSRYLDLTVLVGRSWRAPAQTLDP